MSRNKQRIYFKNIYKTDLCDWNTPVQLMGLIKGGGGGGGAYVKVGFWQMDGLMSEGLKTGGL